MAWVASLLFWRLARWTPARKRGHDALEGLAPFIEGHGLGGYFCAQLGDQGGVLGGGDGNGGGSGDGGGERAS